jgi:hypothetical protein
MNNKKPRRLVKQQGWSKSFSSIKPWLPGCQEAARQGVGDQANRVSS